MISLLRNKEVKRYIVIIILLHILLSVIIVGSFRKNAEKLHRQVVSENIAALGSILNRYPQLERETITFFTGNYTDADLETGLEIATKYGINEDMPLHVNNTFREFYRRHQHSLFYTGMLFLLLSLIVYLIILSMIYRKIRNFSHYAESIVEGDFESILEIQEEGDFAVLTLQFNDMAKRLQGTLQSLEQEKIYLKDTISDISHQLKTPLASIKMFNELLIDGEINNSETALNFLDKSQGQIDRMEWLIKNLLKMAKLEIQSIDFNNKLANLNDTIEKSILPLKVNAQNKNQSINTCLDSNIALIHDEKWLGEAISNVVKNALEHTPEGGKVSIETEETPLAARIYISDEGQGISSEDLPHVFKRFYKGKNNLKSESTGIGLALTKAIIENQNGTIMVKNNKKGITFTIVLFKDESY
ncbi:HAMP domain-containing sensor histidine kinase [Serpentinicella sp. ANB-PHB4]|uniref:sensor histidine kinase n=1 Tax=Serpentinicella sp. ANB-PHB4 TaxID=3074076 RepID=UPI00285FA919|nr:HAMP domain-containing sensor histidine kinase [Serpentinicella sp. ANB-PHB4]MDR5660045.1 HAMP domain-containing sensor histidine kinase [Serpentinicella sp. ANB-PHB4]